MLKEALDNITFLSAPRNYIGASSIGHPCPRKLKLDLDRTEPKELTFRQRLIFHMGHQIEECLLEIAREHLPHIEIMSQQTNFKTGELEGNVDAIIKNKKTGEVAILEIKSANEKRFKNFVDHPLKQAEMTYWSQCQAYMGGHKIYKCLFFVVNKNTGETHESWVPYDHTHFKRLIEKADYIKNTKELPLGFSQEKKQLFVCRFCEYKDFCWEGRA